MRKYMSLLSILLLFITACATEPAPYPLTGENHWTADKVYEVREMAPHYRIISFDGGGIKGILTAKLLTMIEETVPGFLSDVKLYAGTSTGGIIALSLAYGKTPEQIVELYRNNGELIFTPYPAWFGRGVTAPLYTNENLIEVLKNQFPENPRLSGLNKKVLVTSFKLSDQGSWKPVWFTNFGMGDVVELDTSAGLSHPSLINEDDLLVDIAVRTSAAPVYFPAYQGYIDGGVFANNPAIVALAAALDSELGNAKLGDIRLLSLSTGNSLVQIAGTEEDWGAVQWLDPFDDPAVPLLSILMDGVMEDDDYLCSLILDDNYKRFDLQLGVNYAMDDWKQVEYLLEQAAAFPEEYPEEWGLFIKWIVEDFLQ